MPHQKRSARTRSLEKKLAIEVKELQANYPEAEIQLWCSSEHRLGLKPILQRVYVPFGETPIANVNWRFQWLWLYAFVHPQSGESYYWILPYVNTELFNQVLADFAHEFGLGANKRILLAIDQAGWHPLPECQDSSRTTFNFFAITLTRITTGRTVMDSS